MSWRNETLRSQARKIIYNVNKYMQKEAIEGVNNVHQVQKRTAEATGTSVQTVQRILKQANKSGRTFPVFRTPGKKRPRKKPVSDIDAIDQGIIKRCIHNFHITNEKLPTIKKLHTKLRSDINFQGSGKSLNRVIKKLGFQWKKTEYNWKIIIEKTDIRLKRIEYLEKLKKYRQDKRPIVYTYESFIYLSQSNSKSGLDESIQSGKKSITKRQDVIVVHAGSENGFVPKTLFILKSESNTGDYNRDMNFENYQNWLRTQLLPNLPPQSVVVVSNHSYHSKPSKDVPTSNSKRLHMVSWLTEKGINYSPTMLKPQLYNLIKLHRDRFIKCDIDQLMTEHGHDVLRLPPYHPDLNPVEIAWTAIKRDVSSKNVNFNGNSVMELIKEKVDDMGANEWNKLCEKVKEAEESYAKSDYIIDQLTEELNIRDDDDSDSGSDSGWSSVSNEDNVPDTTHYSQPDDLMDGVVILDTDSD